MCSICKKEVRCDQSADVNCVPLSDVIVCGTPNLEIQVEQSASAQVEAVMEDSPLCGAVHHGKNVCFPLRVEVGLLCRHERVKSGALE